MKVALQVYTIREHLKDLTGFTAAMKQVREIGYENVELAGVGDVKLDDQRRVCDDAGLRIIATHTPLGDLRQDIDAVIEKHKLLGAEYVVLPWLPGELRSAAGYKAFAKEATGFAARLKDAGLGFAYHNHSFEFEKYEGRTGFEILWAESDPALVGSELDTYWVQHGGASPAAWIQRLRGRVPILHLKDFVIKDGKQLFAPVGEGNLDWPGIIAAAKKAGTRWLAVEQDTCQIPSMESVAVSFRNLRAMGLC